PLPLPLLALALSLFAAGLSAADSLLVDSLPAPSALSADFDSGFADAYRSLYQPPPFSWNAVREINRSSAPPHASQTVLSGSLMRCWYSNSLPQALHWYSYTGISRPIMGLDLRDRNTAKNFDLPG